MTIAGSDSGGGAGIQADLKTFHQFGVFGTSVIVALTAQNTRGVRSVHPVPPDMVRDQLDAVAEDLPPAALKTGMLATAPLVHQVAEAIRARGWSRLVVDPVMVATSGARLLDPEAELVVRDTLLPLAALVTPNLEEAGILAGMPVTDIASMERAGRRILETGVGAVLVKAGHLAGPVVEDILVSRDGIQRFRHPRVDTTATHGTGCTLSAAVTAGLALGLPLDESVGRGIAYVHRALRAAPGLGGGRGPLRHDVPTIA
ncbi:MAG TPA: bifunctional hydroxymethylpyrimidine kinase/phosphomethylpyrimidine kinase [Gemmatimonadales bacterium]|nr:bifunctional hydroxymethylpyrimidine kinase/phosphomethylpyrimidine kinase [Gemmatimonadales bacterium]